jgi:hypothetical protein
MAGDAVLIHDRSVLRGGIISCVAGGRGGGHAERTNDNGNAKYG